MVMALSASAHLGLCPFCFLLLVHPAWQQEEQGVRVFANGDSCSYQASILPALIHLCESWQLEGDSLRAALDNPECRDLLDYLLENGCIYVE